MGDDKRTESTERESKEKPPLKEPERPHDPPLDATPAVGPLSSASSAEAAETPESPPESPLGAPPRIVDAEPIQAESGQPLDAESSPPRTPYPEQFQRNLEELLSAAGGIADSKQSAKRSDQIGRLIVLARRMQNDGASAGTYYAAYLAVRALGSPSFGGDAAERIINDLEFRTSSSSPIYLVLNGLTRAVMLLFALFIIVFVLFIVAIYTNSEIAPEAVRFLIDLGQHPLIISIVFGILGSVVSILLRISEFEGSTRSKQFLITTGAILPIVGAIFASVACALFSSKLITFSIGDASLPTDNKYFYVVLGFLSGFSERFMRGLLGRVEDGFTLQAGKQVIQTGNAVVTTTEMTGTVRGK